MRDRVVSVRFSSDEHKTLLVLVRREPLTDARGRERRSLAHWCRAAINRSILRDDLRPGMPTLTVDDLTLLVEHCQRLNDLTRESHTHRQIAAGTVDSLAQVCATALRVLPRPERSAKESDDRMTKLVNLRVSDDDYVLWSQATEEASFPRVSAWARDVLVGLAGYVESRTVTSEVAEARRQLAGAINNASQLHYLAEEVAPSLARKIEEYAIELIELIAAWTQLGKAWR